MIKIFFFIFLKQENSQLEVEVNQLSNFVSELKHACPEFFCFSLASTKTPAANCKNHLMCTKPLLYGLLLTGCGRDSTQLFRRYKLYQGVFLD